MYLIGYILKKWIKQIFHKTWDIRYQIKNWFSYCDFGRPSCFSKHFKRSNESSRQHENLGKLDVYTYEDVSLFMVKHYMSLSACCRC